MEAFDQTLTQPAIKEEVSDAVPTLCEDTDDESTRSSPLPVEKREADELDSEASSSSGNGLPPRKRAKTTEEKEQRRVERVMRNRQAAHASREKKRKHLETLESKCTELESENTRLRSDNMRLEELQARVEQLESAIMLARSSGDVNVLDSVSTPSWDSAPKDELQHIPISSLSSDNATSPAPSLEDDCASPDALFLQYGSDSPQPRSPSLLAIFDQDSFESSFSLDSPLFASTDIVAHPEGSSKARHPAVVTPPRVLV